MAEGRRLRIPPLPTPTRNARLARAKAAGADAPADDDVVAAEARVPGRDALGRFYANPPGPLPKPPVPKFRTKAAAEIYEQRAALEAERPAKAKPKAATLETAADVAVAIRDVAHRVLAGEISAIEGVRQTRVLQALHDTLGGVAFQARLDRIERALMRDRRMR